MNLQLKDREVQRALVDDRLNRFRREARAHRLVRESQKIKPLRRFSLVEQLKSLFAKTEVPRLEQPLVKKSV